ncbi:MAG: isoprenylcysteine carboxylmethyltransferase family protein [Gammaproteobacteria bacterium]|nr:isoprenylcysteine carboxylmethyltransferase family protein [Gammaproteobacteria bacterium]
MSLRIKTLPIVYVIIFSALMYGCTLLFPENNLNFEGSWQFALAVFTLGLILIATGGIQFRRAGTTVNPMTPGNSSSLVMTGIYAYSRNPMYVGFLLFLIAVAIVVANIVALVFLPLFVLAMNYLQIQPEENALEDLFGEEYRQYRKRVRRWL